MPEESRPGHAPVPRRWVATLAQRRPDVVLMAPFIAYLLLLTLSDRVPRTYLPVAIAIRGVGALAVVWLFWRHFPPMGKAHWGIAIVVGTAVALGWVAGQELFNRIGLGGRWIFLDPKVPVDPRQGISALSWWLQAGLRIAVASTAVPIVEELFWRAFLLRALIDWDRFEQVPLGTFTWFSFLATSLLSTLEHPDNWAVSILCWLVYNALFCWKKSILCLIVTHGVTNLVLYLYVLWAQAWLFW